MLMTNEEKAEGATAPEPTVANETTTPAGKKIKKAAPIKDKPAAIDFIRGDIVIVSPTDSNGIYLKTLANGNARVANGRNRIEVITMAVMQKLNKKGKK